MPNSRDRLNFRFGQISPPISLDYVPLLWEFDLKKTFTLFKDLDEFYQSTCYKTPIIRNGRVALNAYKIIGPC